MLSKLFSTRRRRIAAAAITTVALAGIAFAFFSTSGTGNGNAQAGTSTPVTITATITPGTGGIVPGGNPATVSFSVNNPGSGNQYVNTVSLTGVQAYSDAQHTNNITGTGAGQCDTTKFSMGSVSEGEDVPPGATTLTRTGSLNFADSGSNQDGCKNAYLVASFSSN